MLFSVRFVGQVPVPFTKTEEPASFAAVNALSHARPTSLLTLKINANATLPVAPMLGSRHEMPSTLRERLSETLTQIFDALLGENIMISVTLLFAGELVAEASCAVTARASETVARMSNEDSFTAGTLATIIVEVKRRNDY